jgi:hypothetical protein
LTFNGLHGFISQKIYIYNYGRKTQERKRPLGRPKRKEQVNVKIHLKGRRWEAEDWIRLAQDRV